MQQTEKKFQKEEAISRKNDEDEYFRKISQNCIENKTKFYLSTVYESKYSDQLQALKAYFNNENESVDQSTAFDEGNILDEIARAGETLDPEEEPRTPIVEADINVYGRLGKVIKKNIFYFSQYL